MKLAIGFFDGVHLGHRRILSRADAALTFAVHPLSVLAPARAPALLMTLAERLAAIRSALGPLAPASDAEAVRALPFTPQLAAMPPEDFAALLRRLYPACDTIVCGANWRFGAGGKGTAENLAAWGFQVETVPFEVMHLGGNDAPVLISSTRIRSALAAGKIEDAQKMLGRQYAIGGEVKRGKGLGKKLGYPTINLHPANPDLRRLLPPGVYAVETDFGPALANWGVAPTFASQAWKEPVLEVHLLDAPAAADQPAAMKVALMSFIRPERKFGTPSELQTQIAEDIKCVTSAFCA